MKTAKFIIMLQVLFLIGVFVFSVSAVYRPGNAGPLAITNLAIRQPGYEIASPEHNTYQARLSSMDSMARAAEEVKADQVPDNAKVLAIPGADSPVYLVSFLDETDKTQFLIAMARSDQSGKIAAVIEKNIKLSDQLGIFVGLPPAESIENVIADSSKASSAGMTEELKHLTIRLQDAELNFKVLQDGLKLTENRRDNTYAVLLDAAKSGKEEKEAIIDFKIANAEVIRLRNKAYIAESKIVNIKNNMAKQLAASTSKASSAGMTEELRILVEQMKEAEMPQARMDASYAIAAKGPDAYPALPAIYELLVSEDTSIHRDAAFIITTMGPIARPFLNEKLETTIGEQAAVIREIIKNIAPISKAHAAGMNQLDQLMIEFEKAKLELKTLQEQLKVAEADESSIFKALTDANKLGKIDEEKARSLNYEEVINKTFNLEEAIDMARLKSTNLQNIITTLTASTSKASAAGINQVNELAKQLEDAALELETLRDKLVIEKIAMDSAAESSDTYNEAAAKADEIQIAIKAAELRFDNLQDIRTILISKASSAGYQRDVADAMAVLSNTTVLFTDVNTIPELNIDMLSKQIEAYKETINTLESIKAQSPDAAIAVAEHFERAQASLNTMTAIQNIAAEDAALENITGTIVINDNDIPDNQQILLTMLDKANPYLEALETKLGCKVRLLSQYNAKVDGAANMIAISSMSVDGISRRVDINSIIQDGFLPLEEVIVIAKGLLTYNQDTAPALNGIIARMYRSITKAPMQQELLEAFLRNSVFVLDLPIPLAIDEAYYEQLHRQALAALIAA